MEHQETSPLRLDSVAMLGAVLGFVILFAVAALAYPGGTYFDHASVGHDFWRNTMCDVARTVALDGAENRVGCAFARAAMTLLALGVGALFIALPRLFAHERLGKAVRVLGAATVPFAIAVVNLPTDRYGQLHGIAIVFAGTLGLSAALLAMKGLLADPRAPRLVVALGALALAVAAVDFGLYVRELIGATAAQVAVAVLERIATLLVLGWMLAVARVR